MVMNWVAPLGAAGRTERERMQISTSQGAERCYRLIDDGCEPHRELDAQYSSLDDAIAAHSSSVLPTGINLICLRPSLISNSSPGLRSSMAV